MLFRVLTEKLYLKCLFVPCKEKNIIIKKTLIEKGVTAAYTVRTYYRKLCLQDAHLFNEQLF